MSQLSDFQFLSLLAFGFATLFLLVRKDQSTPSESQEEEIEPRRRRFFVPPRVRRVSGPPLPEPYRTVGILRSEALDEDTIFILQGRRYRRDPNRYQYRVIDTETDLVLDLNEREPMNEIFTGNVINSIPGKESVGSFVAEIHKPEFTFNEVNFGNN